MKRPRALPPSPVPAWMLTFTCLTFVMACSGSSKDGSSSSDGSDGSSSSDGSLSNSNGTTGGSGDAGGSGGSTSTSSASSSGGAPGTGGSNNDATDGSAGAGGDCPVDVEAHALETGYHVTECSHIDYSTNPPCTGEHYPVWAAYQTYDFPVPRGYWVHSLEHGAIVITYNCEDGCPDEVQEVQGMIDDLPADLRCAGTGIDVQVVLTPDPLLDVRWGLASWGNTLRADCVNLAAFEQFYFDHLGQGPEDICGGGVALTADDVTPGCGE